MNKSVPFWLIGLLGLPVLPTFALMAVGLSLAASDRRVSDVVSYSTPFLLSLGMGCFGWWAWTAGWRIIAVCSSAITLVILMLYSLLVFFVGF